MAEPAKKTTTPSTPAPKNDKPREPKDARFRRLGERRVPRALKAIDAIGNLANKSQYEYTTEQAEKIVKALTDAVAAVKGKLQGLRAASDTFRL